MTGNERLPFGERGDCGAGLELAYWTRKDAERMDRLFRQSARMRDKWDSPRGETTWGAIEIKRALDKVVKVYEPPQSADSKQADAPPRTILSRALSEIEAERITWLMEGYIPLGELTLNAAPGGVGKTHVNFDLAVRVAAGLPMPLGVASDLTAAAGVVIITSENPAAKVMRPHVEATARALLHGDAEKVSACLARIRVIDGVSVQQSNGVSVTTALRFPQDVEPLRALIRAWGIRLLIFDPLLSYMSGEIEIIDSLDVRHLLDSLAALARDEDIAIVATIHFSKRTEGDFITRVSGSRQFTDTARSVFTVLVEGRQEIGGEIRRWLASAKLNLGRTPPALSFFIEGAPHPRYADAAETSVVSWEQTRDIDAETLDAELRATRDAKPHTEAYAVMALTQRLSQLWEAGERVVGSEMLEAWRIEIDVSKATWIKARTTVGIKTHATEKGGRWIADLRELPLFAGREEQP